MRITIDVTVREDDGARTTLTVEEDQWLFGRDEDRPLAKVRSRALTRTREALDRLIERSAK